MLNLKNNVKNLKMLNLQMEVGTWAVLRKLGLCGLKRVVQVQDVAVQLCLILNQNATAKMPGFALLAVTLMETFDVSLLPTFYFLNVSPFQVTWLFCGALIKHLYLLIMTTTLQNINKSTSHAYTPHSLSLFS